MSVYRREYIENLFKYGQSPDHASAKPQYEPIELITIAERFLRYVDVPNVCPKGRHLALVQNYRLIPRSPRGLCGEGASHRIIAYHWDLNEKERELSVIHGFTHCLAEDFDLHEATDGDIWILTAFLSVPNRIEEGCTVEEVCAWAHVPTWFVSARIDLKKRLVIE